MIYHTDIFGNELRVGDKILTSFTYAGASVVSIAEVSSVGTTSIQATAKMHDIKNPDCYSHIKKDWTVYHCYKISKEDWGLDFANFDIYMKNRNLKSKILFEITGRELRSGDPVLVFNRKGSLEDTKIGIVISDTQVFIGDKVERNRHVFLLEHLKENELAEYHKLTKLYLSKKQDKLSSSIGLNYNIGDILYNKSSTQVYMYLGKKQIKRYNLSGEELNCKPIYSFGGHCYLKFNLNVLSEKYLYDCLVFGKYKDYPYAKPIDFTVFNTRDAVAQQLHSKGFYEGQLLALTVLKEKKEYVYKIGHVDLSSIKNFEVWQLGKSRGPRVEKKYIDEKNKIFLGKKNSLGFDIFSFLDITNN